MKWDKALDLGATKLAAILGCPVTTAHSWIRRSGPPDWQKPHYLRTIEAEQGGADQPAARRGAKRKVGKKG